MAQIPQRNFLNIKLGSANGIKINQTRKIDFLSYNDLYNYAINGAVKEFEAKYTDVTFKAGSQVAINVAGLHKEDFMSTTKETILEELHTELLKTKQNENKNNSANTSSEHKFKAVNKGFKDFTLIANPLVGHITDEQINLVSGNKREKEDDTVTQTTTISEDKATNINIWITNFISGHLTVAQLKVNLDAYNIKYTETKNDNFNIFSFSYEINEKTKNITIKCNEAASEAAHDSVDVKTYTLDDLKKFGLTDTKLIDKYLDVISSENGIAKEYAIKPQYGVKTIEKLRNFVKGSILGTNYISDKYDNGLIYNIEKLTMDELLSTYDKEVDASYSVNYDDEEEELLKQIINKFCERGDDRNILYDLLKYLPVNILGLTDKDHSLNVVMKFVYHNEVYWIRTPEQQTNIENSTIIQNSYDDNYKQNTSQNRYLTTDIYNKDDNYGMDPYFYYTTTISTDYDKKNPYAYIKESLRNKLGSKANDKVISNFINYIHEFYDEYDTSKFTKAQLDKVLELYVSTLNNISMQTNQEQLVRNYNPENFLTEFASDNYTINEAQEKIKTNTNQTNDALAKAERQVLDDLISNVSQNYQLITGSKCSFNSEQIENVIKTVLQNASNNNSMISAYEIIIQTIDVLRKIDNIDASETLKTAEEISKYGQESITLIEKGIIYIKTQLHSGKNISISEFKNIITSEFSDKYTDNEINGMLLVAVLGMYNDAGIDEETIKNDCITLFTTGSLKPSINLNESGNSRKVRAKSVSGFLTGKENASAADYFYALSNFDTGLGKIAWGVGIGLMAVATVATGGLAGAAVAAGVALNTVTTASAVVYRADEYCKAAHRGENPDAGKFWLGVTKDLALNMVPSIGKPFSKAEQIASNITIEVSKTMGSNLVDILLNGKTPKKPQKDSNIGKDVPIPNIITVPDAIKRRKKDDNIFDPDINNNIPDIEKEFDEWQKERTQDKQKPIPVIDVELPSIIKWDC